MSSATDYEANLAELLKSAMKTGDKRRLMAVRALKSALTTERTKTGKPLQDEDSIKLIASYRKKMASALDQYREVDREDLIASAETEIALCDELLPARIELEELERLVEAQIAETGASSPQEMGQVIGPLMKKLAGRVDGNEVRQIVMRKLGGSS